MEASDLEYIFSNIDSDNMNIYNKITTLNTMKQYVNLTKKLNFNYDEGIGKGNQKTLTLKRIDGTVIGEVKDRRYPRNTRESVDIVTDKFITESLLNKASIKTTNSIIYNENEIEKAKKDFFENTPDKLVVIKPTNLSQGVGVNVRVSKENFEYFWNDTITIMRNAKRRNIQVMVQDYIEGFEARAVVIEGELISVVARVPAYIKGDGKNSIRTLIIEKNNQRRRCAHLRHRPLVLNDKIERFIKDFGYTKDDIPEKNKYVLLSSLSNISHGGEMVDITDYVGEEIKNTAISSIAAIPGMYSGGVDIMMTDFNDLNSRIIELNAWPMLQSTLYPTYGSSHDPQGYFLNAFYAIDQFLNKPKQIYNINNSEEYVATFIKFQQLKCEIYEKQLY